MILVEAVTATGLRCSIVTYFPQPYVIRVGAGRYVDDRFVDVLTAGGKPERGKGAMFVCTQKLHFNPSPKRSVQLLQSPRS
jgi:hypothetical protein